MGRAESSINVRVAVFFERAASSDRARNDSTCLAPRGRAQRIAALAKKYVYPSPPTEGLLCKPCFGGCFARARPPYHQGDFGECVAEVKTQTKSYTRLPRTSRQPQLPQDGRIARLQRLLDGRRADAARDGLERRPRQRHQVGARPVVLGAPRA